MRKARFAIFFAVSALIQAGLYLAYTSNVGVRELVAAALTGAIATSAAMVFARAGDISFRFRLRDVAQAWRMPWYALNGTVEVMHALFRQLFTRQGAPSFTAAVAFEMGPEDSLKDAGRRALAVTYTTATPNSIVLGTVREQGIMIYHQIMPGKIRALTKNLGARP